MIVLHKKILILILLIVFTLTPLTEAQEYDFQEIRYSVFLSKGSTSLNLKPVFKFQNDFNHITFDINYDSKYFRLGGTWLINALNKKNYKTDIGFSILTKPTGNGFTAGVGVSGNKKLQENRKILYDLKYILANNQFEYRIGYQTPIIKNNDLIVSLGNSYWQGEALSLEVGFKAQF